MDKQRYHREEAPLEDIFGFSYQSHLNLITCTGEFNDEAKTHEERLVIYTELKK
ncbi:class F sortase [Paenibacillus sp. LPE1-1-1.1]|uniref:class F sortase n=1 Tax=Paenibacillus sp. LPE1-1-1.1 TaxID=3135230 RepID=UPI003446D7AF